MVYRTIVSEVNAKTIHCLMHYDPETGKAFRKKATGELKEIDAVWKGVISAEFCKKRYPITHLIWLYVTGRWPKKGFFIDHKDGNATNNKFDNLREATPSQNGANRGCTVKSKSGIKRVYWYEKEKKWRAFITCNQKQHWLGNFDSAKEAKAVYDKKALELFGEFARS